MTKAKRWRRIALIAAQATIVLAAILLLAGSHGMETAGPEICDIKTISNVMASVDGAPAEAITLPHEFKHLRGRTRVVLEAEIQPDKYDAVYIKSIHAPAKIYMDGRLAYEYGNPDNYPDYMSDPAIEIHMTETDGKCKPMKLRMEFLSPLSLDTLTVCPPMLGTSKELIYERHQRLGYHIGLAIVQILLGIALIFIALFIIFLDKKSVIFIYLGMFLLTTGIWSFGLNEFNGIILKNTAALYLMSCIAFFVCILPLFRFAGIIINFRHPAPLRYMELCVTLLSCAALILQLAGALQFSVSMYYFHIIVPVMLTLLTLYTACEAWRFGNVNAWYMLLPLALLALSGFLEAYHYQRASAYVYSSIFQLGVLFFLLAMGIAGGIYLKSSMDLQSRQRQLDFEKDIMKMQLEEQKSRRRMLSQSEEELRIQRHDLRHQLMVIQELSNADNGALKAYLAALISNIPKPPKVFCENMAVNAVVARYSSICQSEGIKFSAHIAVPDDNQHITDSGLCVIFGNLLENAVEACGRMSEGEKFIKLTSSLQYDMLAITMDNSFNGVVHEANGRFRSSKRDEFGVGLASVKAVADKAQGFAEFKSEGLVFLSSVYVRL